MILTQPMRPPSWACAAQRRGGRSGGVRDAGPRASTGSPFPLVKSQARRGGAAIKAWTGCILTLLFRSTRSKNLGKPAQGNPDLAGRAFKTSSQTLPRLPDRPVLPGAGWCTISCPYNSFA